MQQNGVAFSASFGPTLILGEEVHWYIIMTHVQPSDEFMYGL
jgi:hypothetical protein